MANKFLDAADVLFEYILWADSLKDSKGNSANSFCLQAMERFNRDMKTYQILHKQPKCKPIKPEKARRELLKKG